MAWRGPVDGEGGLYLDICAGAPSYSYATADGAGRRANGWMSSGVAVKRSVRALTRRLMRWLGYYTVVQACLDNTL